MGSTGSSILGSVVGIGMTAAGSQQSYAGGKMQGSAAQGAAIDSQNQARTLYSNFMDSANKNSSQLNLLAANPQQLQALTQSLGTAQRQAESDQKLLDAIDPAIMEASKQALSILNGGQSATSAATQAQIGNQRQQLVNSLREQYGPGAETSAVGQQQLRQFDLQNNQLMAQTQQQSLAQLFGLAGQGGQLSSSIGSGMQNRFSQAAQGFGQYAQQGMSAQSTGFGQMSQGMQAFGQGLQNTAGAQFVRDQVRGAGKQQMGNSMINGGATIASSAAASSQRSGQSGGAAAGAGKS